MLILLNFVHRHCVPFFNLLFCAAPKLKTQNRPDQHLSIQHLPKLNLVLQSIRLFSRRPKQFMSLMFSGLMALVFCAPSAVAKTATPMQSISQAGEYAVVLPSQRQYLLYVPPTLSLQKAAPLVLFFHGGGGNQQQAADSYGWRDLAAQHQFIVAFPNGYSRFRRGKLATWNVGACCGDARDEQVDDVAFIKALLADVAQRVRVDKTQIYATGMSNGGMMVYRLACEMAETFAAVAAVAGTDNTEQCQPRRAIAILHIHAKDDTHVLYTGGAGADAFRDRSKVTDFTSVAQTLERWRQRYALSTTTPVIEHRPSVQIETYTGNSTASALSERQVGTFQLVTTETGGHSWPGAKAVRRKTPSNAINANEHIWQFFQQYGVTKPVARALK